MLFFPTEFEIEPFDWIILDESWEEEYSVTPGKEYVVVDVNLAGVGIWIVDDYGHSMYIFNLSSDIFNGIFTDICQVRKNSGIIFTRTKKEKELNSVIDPVLIRFWL